MHSIGNKSDSFQDLLDNQPPGTEVRFDGKFLRIYRDGKEVFRMKAVSGRAQDDGSFDYSNSNQQNKGKGPIPEGSYSIDPSKVQSFQDQSMTSFLKGFVSGGSFPGGTYSWGNERVWINVEGNTNVYGRSGFTIHGGAVYGSAGCIDLGPNSSIFFKALMKLNLEGIRNVPLNVKYK